MTDADFTAFLLNSWRSPISQGKEETGPAGEALSPGGILPRAALVSLRYRGAFETGERSPRRVRVGISEAAGLSGSASVRFRTRSLLFRRGRDFGVSVDIDPSFWKPLASRKGWQFFIPVSFPDKEGHTAILGLWSSLPATWLAQKPDGTVLPPPWRELWTFGPDHIWQCRVAPAGESSAETFMADCLEWSPEARECDRWLGYLGDEGL